MAKKSTSERKKTLPAKKSSPGKNVFLALTLVPFVLGLILLGAWVLDIEVLDDLQSQITVGILFFLLSFTASNALQKRWMLAAGWGVLVVADLIVLAWLDVRAQIVALSVGAVGAALLGYEFFRQIGENRNKSSQ